MSSKGAEAWVEKLSQTEMPILAVVMKQLNRLTGDYDTEYNKLAELILKDPHLTSHILRIVNSVQYNPSNVPINTVSRAIVMLGFKGIRSLTLSLMVVDSLLGKEPRERLLKTMAEAFHTAVQAEAIHKQIKDKGHEEVFIAALLHNLGEMAFWSYGGKTADKLEREFIGCDSYDPEIIQKELGTSFKTLSRELGKVWKLGDTLQEALSNAKSVSPAAQSVRFGREISSVDPKDEIKRKEMINRVTKFIGCSAVETRNLINKATESAASVALEYGASQVCHLMPRQQDIERKEKREKQHQNNIKEARILEADPNLQLKILRDLSNAVNEKVDVNTVFQMTLEGMHRGIGLERVVLAFIKNNQIRAKYVLGEYQIIGEKASHFV